MLDGLAQAVLHGSGLSELLLLLLLFLFIRYDSIRLIPLCWLFGKYDTIIHSDATVNNLFIDFAYMSRSQARARTFFFFSPHRLGTHLGILFARQTCPFAFFAPTSTCPMEPFSSCQTREISSPFRFLKCGISMELFQ